MRDQLALATKARAYVRTYVVTNPSGGNGVRSVDHCSLWVARFGFWAIEFGWLFAKRLCIEFVFSRLCGSWISAFLCLNVRTYVRTYFCFA